MIYLKRKSTISKYSRIVALVSAPSSVLFSCFIIIINRSTELFLGERMTKYYFDFFLWYDCCVGRYYFFTHGSLKLFSKQLSVVYMFFLLFCILRFCENSKGGIGFI